MLELFLLSFWADDMELPQLFRPVKEVPPVKLASRVLVLLSLVKLAFFSTMAVFLFFKKFIMN